MSCGCNDYNPADFTLYQNTVFGPTDDDLAPSIYYVVKINGVVIPLTGYTAKMSMRPVGGGSDTLTLESIDSPPLTCLVINAPDGSIAPYFNPADVDMLPGFYEFDILLNKDTDPPIYLIGGTITVKETVTIE